MITSFCGHEIAFATVHFTDDDVIFCGGSGMLIRKKTTKNNNNKKKKKTQSRVLHVTALQNIDLSRFKWLLLALCNKNIFQWNVYRGITRNNLKNKEEKMSRDMTNPTKWVCDQRRLRSAWASTQSDQSLRCPHEESSGPYLPIERTTKTLIRLGGCPGWSESSLGAQSLCWFCRVVAQIN